MEKNGSLITLLKFNDLAFDREPPPNVRNFSRSVRSDCIVSVEHHIEMARAEWM